MCSDHPEFRVQLQTISVTRMRAENFWRTGRPGTQKSAIKDRYYCQF
jgi:hypothetical protein